ncbi:hypothetical protein [Microscilla marina]|uniref:Uncharacterized protein n=1 Tax=Microscilla marina ATCC 23134 TaxID=313606 RepID=A1ZVD0_MICM2|nr:hypothetical protein [Microscilla marina]EAY25628.1 hypothetical protein M23134_07279 [Microscilla marina ATCC 23134]
MEPIHEDKKTEPVVQTATPQTKQTNPEMLQAEGKPATYQSVGVGRPSKYQSIGVGRAQKYESLAYQLQEAVGKIPRPDLQAMAKHHPNNSIAFVNAVVDYYRKGIVTYKANPSKLLTDERIIQVYFKIHFGLYVKVTRIGVEFTHDPGSRVRPGVQVLVDAIRQAKRQANNIVAKARAGNQYTGKKSVNYRAAAKDLVTGTYQKPKRKLRPSTPNLVKSKTYDRHDKHYKEPFESYGMSFSGNGDWPVIHGMDGEVDLMIDLKEIMPAMGAVFSDRKFFYKTGIKFIHHLDELAKVYKNLRSVHSKLKQIGDNSPNHAQVAAALAGVTQSISESVIQLGKRIREVETPAQKQELIKSCSSTLQKHGFPGISHELYTLIMVQNDETKKKKTNPMYRTSKKHPGYFLRVNYNGKTNDENDINTAFYKVKKAGMKPHYLNDENDD